jgi:hypothetical protein
VSTADNRALCTGQPVWVLERDGSLRPAEYVGEATSACPEGQGQALVIYVDAPGHGIVDVDHLRRQEADRQPCAPERLCRGGLARGLVGQLVALAPSVARQ